MALKFEIDSESFAGLDESVQGLYTEHNDGYRLDVEGIDPADELKSALSKEREDRKQAKSALDALRKEQENKDRAAAEEKGEFEKLYKSAQDELNAERQQAREFKDQITQRDIKSSALNIAHELAAKDAKRAEVLADYASKYAKFEDGEIIYEIGGVKVDKSAVSSHLKTEFPFLVDGSQATGGGANGGGDGVTTGKEVPRSEWDRMSQADRSKLVKSGGKPVDQTH